MKRRLVLVVAQDVVLRAVMARSLGAAGYGVELAENARRAGELLAAGGIDAAVVVTDGLGPAGARLVTEARDALGSVVVFGSAQEFDEPALRSRIAALLAASSGAAANDVAPLSLLSFAGCKVDLDSRAFFVDFSESPRDGAARSWGADGVGAIGEAPDRAEQLAMTAPDDGVMITEGTRRLVGRIFECRAAGVLPSEGGDPVPIWRVAAEAPFAGRFAARRGRGTAQFVGRGEELALLLRRWWQAEHGAGQVVLVSGEPGIGKSRLAATLAERLRAKRHVRLRCFGSPHHRNSELFPLIGHLERAAGFARGDSAEDKLAKLAAFAAQSGCNAGEERHLLASLLSLPADDAVLGRLGPRQRRERTLALLQAMVERLAAEQPVFLLCEDAQWFDPTSCDLLALTVERAARLRVLLIVTARPEFAPAWADHPDVTMLRLARLPRHDAAALVRQTAGDRPLSDDCVEGILGRGDGVPLFLEELTKAALAGDPAGSRGIPLTLEGLLWSRLDRLGPAREIAQLGAVIGQSFSHELLVLLAERKEFDTALDRLVGSGLVYRQGEPPDATYRFKHALVRDAAYASLSRRRRRELHSRVAAALEQKFPEIVEAEPELLAHHCAEAGLAERSAAYWGKAGRRSAARSAMAEAAAQLQKGLAQAALLPDTPERRWQELKLRSALGAALRTVKGQAAPETGDAYARARELWERLGSPSEFLGVPYGQARYHAFRGEYELAQRLSEDLLQLSRRRGDCAGLVLGHEACGRNLMFAGRFVLSQAHLEEALALYDPICHSALVDHVGVHLHINAQAFLAMVLLCRGFPDQALAQSNAAIAEARRLAYPPSLAVSLAIGLRLLLLIGDNAALDERTAELVRVADEQRLPFYRAMGTIFRGWIKVKNGDVAEGTSLLHSGSTAFRATGSEVWITHHTALLAGACEIAGQIEEGLTLLDNAMEIAERTGARWFIAELNRHKGWLMLRQGRAATAEELYRKALGIAAEQKAKFWELRAAVSLARLHRDQGRRGEARDLLAPVYGRFTEGFAAPDLREARALLDALA